MSDRRYPVFLTAREIGALAAFADDQGQRSDGPTLLAPLTVEEVRAAACALRFARPTAPAIIPAGGCAHCGRIGGDMHAPDCAGGA